MNCSLSSASLVGSGDSVPDDCVEGSSCDEDGWAGLDRSTEDCEGVPCPDALKDNGSSSPTQDMGLLPMKSTLICCWFRYAPLFLDAMAKLLRLCGVVGDDSLNLSI